MMNLYEMMQSAQNGQAMQNLARQYGLNQQQMQSAMDALLPAFSMGLQRQTRDPYAFGNLAQMMTASPFGKLYDTDGDGIPDSAVPMGQDVLAQLFGSREVSNAIAAQAAATSGVGQAILKQMLPIIASMMMGGLMKSAGNQGFGGILGQFADAMRGQSAPPRNAGAQANPTNPFEAILGGLFGGQPPATGQAPGAGPFGGAPMPGGLPGGADMGAIFGQILTGMFGGGQPSEAGPRPNPQSRSQPRPTDAEPSAAPSGEAGPGSIGLDALNEMFETGRKVQADHQDALKSIFDVMLGGGQKKG